MNNLLKAAVLPALTYLADRATDASLSASSGPYAGVDMVAGQSFAGMQGRLNPEGAPIQITPSLEGSSLGTADRWQANADVLVPLAPRRAAWAPYAGAGLCLVGTREGDKRAGLNLMGGLNIALGPLDGFVQARLTLADGVHLSLTGGALPA